MAFDGHTTLKFSREARVLRVTIGGNGSMNPVDEALHEELARVYPERNATRIATLLCSPARAARFASAAISTSQSLFLRSRIPPMSRIYAVGM